MCGIAGHLGPNPPTADRVDACLALMRRRGPDAANVTTHDRADGARATLLHSRLAIIDLDPRSAGPFRVGSKVMTYNGELYSFVEQREKLRQQGVTFRTTSDTEVMLEGLRHEGPAFLDACEGMWALAMFDEADGSMLLSRDRFGEKPLYLYEDEDGLWFGSEVKFITALRGRRLDIDFDHLYRYMVNGYKSLHKQPATFFRGLRELPAGSWLRIDADGTSEEQRYWTISPGTDERMSYDDAVARTRELLIDAVRLRLRADVPLAFCMSGGIDSNSLISVARRSLDFDVHGFTIVNTDARYEEQDIVEASVRELGIRHTSIPVEPTEFLKRLRQLVAQHDAPVYTITYYAQWLLMEAIADAGYKISISGTAADELFTGYFDHHLGYLAAVAGDPERHAVARAEWEEHIRPMVRNPHLRDADLFVRDSSFRDHIYLGAEGFGAALHRPWVEPFFEADYTGELLRNRMLNELFHENVPTILHEDDLNAMYFSVENRSPFLDRRLFEHSMRIPTRHLVQRGYAKVVLRDAMRGIVPDVVLDNHRKVGFNAPIFSFLDVHDPSVVDAVLEDSPIWEHVRREAIVDLMEKADLPNSESKFLFSFLNAKLFLEEHGS